MVRVTLSDAEYAPMHAAAVRAGVSDAAWLAGAGVAMSAHPGLSGPPREWGEAMQQLMALSAELVDDRRVLRNIGGNANDVARAANSGELRAEAGQVLDMVQRAVARIDATLVSIEEQTALARTARRRGAR